MPSVPLIVPLDDGEEEGLHKRSNGKAVKQAHMAAGSAGANANHEEEKQEDGDGEKSSSVLSNELREQFESMKAVWRQARRPSADDLGAEADLSEAQDDEELRRKQRETAVETALAVEAEISKWKNGIAELEAMLADDEDASSDSDGGLSDDEEEEQLRNGNDGEGLRPNRELPQQQLGAHPAIRFPHLPSVVLNDDEYDSSDA